MPDKKSNGDIPADTAKESRAEDTVPGKDPKEPAKGQVAAQGHASTPDGDASKSVEDLLEEERQKTQYYQDKLKYALADYQNLSRKTQSDIESGISAKMDEIMLEFLEIYDNFGRARNAFFERKADVDGLDSILKNMDSLLTKYGIKPIDALGKMFDPNMHEAIAIAHDPGLDDGTITKEIRKGYISHDRIIRPALVERSKTEVN